MCWQTNIYLFKTAKAQWGLLKFEAWSLKSEITVQNGGQKTHAQNSNQSVIIKITQPISKWPPLKLIKPSPNIILTWKVTIHVLSVYVFMFRWMRYLMTVQALPNYISWIALRIRQWTATKGVSPSWREKTWPTSSPGLTRDWLKCAPTAIMTGCVKTTPKVCTLENTSN